MPHPPVIERFAARVEGVEIAAEIWRDLERLRQMAAHETDLFGRNIIVGLDFAGHEAAQRRAAIFKRVKYFAIERDVCRIVIGGVLGQNDSIVRNKLFQHESAVRHHMGGADEIRSKILDGFSMQRLGGHMGELGDKIGCRIFQRDFKRCLVHGAHAQSFDRQFAFVDPCRVLQRIKNIGVGRAGRRRHQPPEREDEIVRGQPVAIRPFGVCAKLKIVGRAGGIGCPTRRGAGNDRAARVIGDEPLEKLVENIAFDQGRGLVRIERTGIAKFASMPNHREVMSRRRGRSPQQDPRRRAQWTRPCGAKHIAMRRHASRVFRSPEGHLMLRHRNLRANLFDERPVNSRRDNAAAVGGLGDDMAPGIDD